MIHLIATMNNPCLHFEFNEAWLLEGETAERPDSELMASRAKAVPSVRIFQEKYPGGRLKIEWSGGVADDGRFLLHGPETWYYEDGRKQREAQYRLGRKTGIERYWSRDGYPVWECEHREDGTSTWRQYWPGGKLKSESGWKNHKADGVAKLWDRSGSLVSEKRFAAGRLAN